MVPLAPLGELPTDRPPEAALAELLRRIDERLEAELSPTDAKRLLMAAWVLIGMCIPRSASQFVEEALTMVDLRDSSTYQLIIEEGMAKGLKKGIEQGIEQGRAKGMVEGIAEGLRTMLLRVGSRRLGQPAATVQASLSAIDDVERLHRMGERALEVDSWQELLDTA